MNAEILIAEHYYKLRIGYQTHLNLLNVDELGLIRKRATELLNDPNFKTSFEQERLIDFIDEIDDRIENFDEIRQKEKRDYELREVIRKKKYNFMKDKIESEDLADNALDENIFIDNSGDLICIVKKEELFNLAYKLERVAIIASQKLQKRFKQCT